MLSTPAIGCVADELALTESIGRVLSRPSQTVECRGLDSGDHDYRNNRDHDITRRENEGKKGGKKKKKKLKKERGKKRKLVCCTTTFPGIPSPAEKVRSRVTQTRVQRRGRHGKYSFLFPISDRLTGQFAIAWFEPTNSRRQAQSASMIEILPGFHVSCKRTP